MGRHSRVRCQRPELGLRVGFRFRLRVGFRFRLRVGVGVRVGFRFRLSSGGLPDAGAAVGLWC